MEDLVLLLVKSYPNLASYLIAVGLLRQVFKPAMLLLEYLTQTTETKRDDDFLNSVKVSRLYKGVSFVLDYTASIKLEKVFPKNKSPGEP